MKKPMPLSPEELSNLYANMADKANEEDVKFSERIAESVMDPEKMERLSRGNASAHMRFPELNNNENMTPSEYAAFYKKMAKDVADKPEDYEANAKAADMTTEELSGLFMEISDNVVRYPEVWESKENAQMLSPSNLSILADALKADTRNAIHRIRKK